MLTLLLSTALAGQVFYEEATLGDLVERSQIILEVKVADPSWTTEKIAVSDEQDCGTYPLAWYHFHVLEVVKGLGADAPTGKQKAAGAYSDQMLSLSRLACVEGTTKSPIYSRYGEGESVRSGDKLIVFLNRHERWGLQVAVADAWVHPKKLKKVKKLVKRL